MTAGTSFYGQKLPNHPLFRPVIYYIILVNRKKGKRTPGGSLPPTQRMPGPAPVVNMIRCEHCGTYLPDGSKFCTECGAKTAPPVNPSEGASQPSPAPQQPVYPQQFDAPPPPAAPQPPVYPQQQSPYPQQPAAPQQSPYPQQPAAPQAPAYPQQQNVYAQPPAAQQQPVYPQQQDTYAYGTQATAPRAATLKEFLKLPENKKLKRQINASAIICYICALITLGLMAAAEAPSMILDVVVVLVLGLLIHITKSKVCAVILLVFAVINTVYILATAQQFGGWLLLIAGGYAVSATFRLDKLWKAYQQQG